MGDLLHQALAVLQAYRGMVLLEPSSAKVTPSSERRCRLNSHENRSARKKTGKNVPLLWIGNGLPKQINGFMLCGTKRRGIRAGNCRLPQVCALPHLGQVQACASTLQICPRVNYSTQ